jgi:DNA-directed RNA polymerase specialized sigma24 family protein
MSFTSQMKARPEREVFELYFVEGLEPERIAMVTSQPLKAVCDRLASVQGRLREEMLASTTREEHSPGLR